MYIIGNKNVHHKINFNHVYYMFVCITSWFGCMYNFYTKPDIGNISSRIYLPVLCVLSSMFLLPGISYKYRVNWHKDTIEITAI